MIKINLLGVAPPPSKVPSVGGPPAAKATQVLVFAGAMIIAFGIVGIIYKIMTSEIENLGKRRSQEIIRKQELAVVKSQNEKYQQRLRDLETRINTIQTLQSSRVGPVELMSSLGGIVNRTSDVYLYTMAPAGERFTLRGQSGTVNSMANFMAYMKNSGTFADVQLDQFYQDDKNERLTYRFTLSAQFKSPTGGPSPTSGAAPVAPTGPAPMAPIVPGGPPVPAGPSGRPALPSGPPPQGVPPPGAPQKLIR